MISLTAGQDRTLMAAIAPVLAVSVVLWRVTTTRFSAAFVADARHGGPATAKPQKSETPEMAQRPGKAIRLLQFSLTKLRTPRTLR